MEYGESPPLDRVLDACGVLMSDVGEASMRAVATRVLSDYAELEDEEKLRFFRHVLTAYDVDADQVRAAFQQWDAVHDKGSDAGDELVRLFSVVEPARQQLLRLFEVVGLEDPWVSAQRRRLSAILFG